jgi:hypothetical protein
MEFRITSISTNHKLLERLKKKSTKLLSPLHRDSECSLLDLHQKTGKRKTKHIYIYINIRATIYSYLHKYKKNPLFIYLTVSREAK